MGQDLSIEHPDDVVFITIRTIGSRLWFVNNDRLHEKVLAFLAKYQEKFGVLIYGFVIMGNHYHLLARFPRMNRAAFLQAFNSIIPRLVMSYVPNFKDGKLWARRARVQVVPNIEDVMDKFLYTAMNYVSSGLCERSSEFNGYCCLDDARKRRGREFGLVDWTDFTNRRRYNNNLRPIDCMRLYTLTYSRLPGFEDLSQEEYIIRVNQLVEARRKELVADRRKKGLGFAGRDIPEN